MLETRQSIERILNEIENGSAGLAKTGSIDDVMELLLGRRSEYSDIDEQTKQPQSTPDSGNQNIFDMDELIKWRDRNNELYFVNYRQPLVTNKKGLLAHIVVFIKGVIRKIIMPVIAPIVLKQNEFNASVTSSVNALSNNEFLTQDLLSRYRKEIDELNDTLKKQREEIDRIKNIVGDQSIYDLIEYEKFEGNFRGSNEDIRKNQEFYIPYFEGKRKVIDLGCGRGEFLQLLKEKNIPAAGVDFYKNFVDECKAKGLDVTYGDALEYVENLPDNSVDGIFAAQLVEHIPAGRLVKLCQDAYKKLGAGGCLIFETPNPTCLSIYTNAFYMDPSHNRPVHPKSLQFYLQNAGFSSVEIVYTDNSRVPYRLPLLNIAGVENLAEINDAINGMTDLIFGSQNYAIVAIK